MKRLVPLLYSDWLSRVRSCYTTNLHLCLLRVLLGNHNCFWGTTLFGGRILFLFALFYFVNLTTYMNKPFYKRKKPRDAVVYSEFITATGIVRHNTKREMLLDTVMWITRGVFISCLDSFWRHPFISGKWWNATFLQSVLIKKQTLFSWNSTIILDGQRSFIFILLYI